MALQTSPAAQRCYPQRAWLAGPGQGGDTWGRDTPIPSLLPCVRPWLGEELLCPVERSPEKVQNEQHAVLAVSSSWAAQAQVFSL